MSSDASAAALTIDQGVEHQTEDRFPAGISWGKLMMWLFLCSDAMSFGALIAAYAAYRQIDTTWPDPRTVLGINLTALMTFILIVSSFTMVKSLAAAKKGDASGLSLWLALTVAGGAFFLGCQAYEWTHLITHGGGIFAAHEGAEGHGGMKIQMHQFAATFYVLTGFHGCHVTGGVIYNSILWLRRKHLLGPKAGIVEVAGLYWHFVDLVWILIFTFVYLI